MPYRELNLEEAATLIIQMKNFPAWLEYTEFARQFFGEEAYRIEVQFTNEYNDEGYDNRITDFEVFDRAGNPLEPSVTPSPKFIEKYDSYTARRMEMDPERYDPESLYFDTRYELPLPLGLNLQEPGEEESLTFFVDRPQDWKPKKIFVEDGE